MVCVCELSVCEAKSIIANFSPRRRGSIPIYEIENTRERGGKRKRIAYDLKICPEKGFINNSSMSMRVGPFSLHFSRSFFPFPHPSRCIILSSSWTSSYRKTFRHARVMYVVVREAEEKRGESRVGGETRLSLLRLIFRDQDFSRRGTTINCKLRRRRAKTVFDFSDKRDLYK